MSRRNAPAAAAINYASSPLLAAKAPPWRSRFVVALVGAAFCVLVGRAVYIQIVGADFYLKQGERRYTHQMDVPASRGRVFDRNGLLLATSVAAPSLWAIPRDFEATPAQRRELARLLGLTPRELAERLDSGSASFAWVRRQVDEAVGAQVKALNIKGLYEAREYKRSYPEGEAAAHVVGFTSIEEKGQEGVEYAFQPRLQGRDGSRTVVKDRLGRVVEDVGDAVEPVNGQDITLSVDSKIQFHAYQKIKEAVAQHRAKAGSVVVLDVQTGEVLALANWPSYNPGVRNKLSGAQLRNRALTDIFEPGSTMKPFIAAWALETGRVTPNTVIDTSPGSITITGSTIRDAHPHGALTVAQIIQKSSNVGTVRLAQRMQPREMWELFNQLGLGQKPQISFPGAASGRLRPYKTWRPIEQATMSYGYGLSGSLLQLARAYTLFARDGEVVPVTLLKQDTPVSGRRVVRPETAQAVRKMLQAAAGAGGTAPKALTNGYSVGGKTGTAHKQEGDGYAASKYRSWFVGLAPVNAPRIVVAVMVDEPSNGVHYGGDVAAPVFSQVVQQTLRMLGLPPDLDVAPQFVARDVVAEKESF